jgi:hypothetical protein
LIEPAIPQIITLLKDSNKEVQKIGADAVLKLSEQGKRVTLSGLAFAH